jgi:hypothetical protein
MILYFCLIEEGLEKERKKKKKKVILEEEDFSRAGPALLSLLQVAAVRCN